MARQTDQRLTVIIPCKDERQNIRPCIEAVQSLADEVLVADSGSTDGTLDIVRSIGGCRIIEREYVHYGDFNNWGVPQASHEWVLVVDADERVTPELANEIGMLLDGCPSEDGYRIRRENYFMGHRIRFSGWNNDSALRLFHRDGSRYVGENDHAAVVVDSGRVGWLQHRMQHFTYWDYDQYFRKFNRYTSWQANVWHQSDRQSNYVRMLFTVPFRFLWLYFARLGILDGMPGLQVCALTAFTSFMKRARLWQLNEGIPQPDPEAEREQQRAA
jgi:glycosyltransferase involved in cell wall biosynthesis